MLARHSDAAADALGTILAIDDEPDVVEMISVYFGNSGYRVIGAGHGSDGLMLAELDAPDVVLLDIMMPGIDGVEVLQQVRTRWPDMPVIMLTAMANEEIAKGALRRGAFDYVRKPFEWEHLERVVAAALTTRKIPA